MADSNRKPDFKAFVSVDTKKGKPFYHEIGAAWKVGKGGISVDLFANPTDGKFVLFPIEEAPEE